ncbi:MAG: TonB-dependent receptor plug domain-containing protein [Pacificimonas sp.]|nr:TonB-dependent receptor plug domain-containing protein [Pacificimonas sp.]
MSLRLLLSTGIALMPAAALAAPAADPAVDPVAVSLAAEGLERRGIYDNRDAARQAPNMVAVTTPGFGSGALYTLRGVGDVGVYLDGARLWAKTANLIGNFHIERIDVVRGPTLSSEALPAAGGALRVRLHQPGEDPRGRFTAHYGAFDEWGVSGSLDLGSAGGVFAVNVGGFYEEGDGYVENLTTGEELNGTDRWGGRIGVRLTPSDTFGWNLGAALMRDRSLNIVNFECDDLCDNRFSTTAFSRRPADPLNPLGGLPVTGEKARNGLGQDTGIRLLTSEMALAVGGGTVTLDLHVVNTDQDFGLDFGDRTLAVTLAGPGAAGTALPFSEDLSLGSRTQSDQTARLAYRRSVTEVLSFDVGLTGFDSSGTLDDARVTDTPGGVRTVAFDRTSDSGARGYTLFGAAALTLGAAELSAGGSWGRTDSFLELDRVLAPALDRSLNRDDEVWSAFADVRIPASDRLTIFGRAARGHGLPDFDLERAAMLGTGLSAPTETTTLEAGVEAGLFGDSVNVRLLGFYLEADGVNAAFAGGKTATSVVSAPLRNTGAEAEFVVRPGAGLTLSGAVGVQSARYEDTAALDAARAVCLADPGGAGCGNGLVTLTGERADPVFAPDLTARGDAAWRIYWARAESFITPRIGVDYRSEMATNGANLPLAAPGGPVTAESRTLVNAGIALETDDDWWLVSLECQNCFDATFVDSSAFGLPYLGRPMTWAIRARRQF